MDPVFKNISTQQLVDALAERMRKGDNEVDHKSLDSLAYYINVRNMQNKLSVHPAAHLPVGIEVVLPKQC